MKVLLSILFLFILVGQSRAERNFDNSKKANQEWVQGHNSIYIESGIFDEQDLNDFSRPDLFFEKFEPVVRPTTYKVKTISVILPIIFTISFQYTLVDLPPPSFL